MCSCCKLFFLNSHAYTPSDASLIYLGATCTPGDYHGSDVNSKALVTCVFQKPVTDNIINEVNASLLTL